MKYTLCDINKLAQDNPKELIEISQKAYFEEINAIAKKISSNDELKIVSIAGPSGSGKTTTAHILCDLLKEYGEETVVVSLDDFYLSGDELPLLPDGTRDIESVNALDIQLINKCFSEIIEFGKTMLPKFDFKTKTRIIEDRLADITNHGIVIIEGLHALNPLITDLVPHKNIYKIYISVNDAIYDKKGDKVIYSKQVRLARRVLRDRIFRGASVNDTLTLWDGVVKGEEKFLYCFKDTADALLKTFHLFEPCIYKDEFISLENEVSKDNVSYRYFMNTANALKCFASLNRDYVPQNSLIREFIGNGKYN